MKIKIAEKIFYRVPQFPLDAFLEQCWPELKQSIALSSPDFYKDIAEVDFEGFSLLPIKVQQTIHKYFNRSKYRPVPFGTFAGVGLIDPKKDDNTTTILIDEIQNSNHFVDWPDKEQLAYSFDDVKAQDCFLFSNSTFYSVQNEIRYIYKNEEGYELAEISSSPLVHQILNACLKPKRLSVLLEHINKSVSENDLLEMIENLITEQLLFTSNDPNIIGQDYFHRIGVTNQPLNKSYVIAERKYRSGNVDKKLLRHFPALVNLLLSLNKTQPIPHHLNSFKEQFLKRFDRMEIPLMHVLDPELGFGYGQLEFSENNANSIADFLPPAAKNDQNDKSLKSKLANQMMSQSPVKCVQLDQLIENMDYLTADYKVSNTISALVQVIDEQIVLSQIGGYSTNQYTGRFSLGSAEIYDFCKETASYEQNANPEILFFDVGYISELKIDNVNRRRQIYNYQLSLLNYDTSDDPLTLDDIIVSIRNNEVILYSKRLNKRLVPRMATAYNHLRSDLSVYRFFSDLATQGLITNLALNLVDLHPDQNYYPRIQFHNIIVSPAMWKLSAKDYSHHLSDDAHKMDAFLSSKAVPRYIKIGFSDQTLLLDLKSRDDRSFLESQLLRHDKLHIEEAFLPENSIITDTLGRPFLGQFILSLRHDHTIYNGVIIEKPNAGNVQRSFVPGSEWLYFELHCHPNRADELLVNQIQQLVSDWRALIRKWFFIRFNEDGEHIRFRIQLHHAKDAGRFLEHASNIFHGEIQCGFITDVKIKTYQREIERYGGSNIENVEAHFNQDSLFVISLLTDNINQRDKYLVCISLFERVAKYGLFDDEQLHAWYITVRNSFTKEHQIKTEGFKKLNKYIKSLMDYANRQTTISLITDTIYDSLIYTLQSCAVEKRLQLFTDLMHMFINRLFAQYQRTHEMIIYEFLLLKIKKKNSIYPFPIEKKIS